MGFRVVKVGKLTGRARVPVFIISYNRGAFLRQVIDSYRRFEEVSDLIVHDNGSDDPETLDILSALEDQGVRIVRNAKIKSADDLNDVNRTVEQYFRETQIQANYVVTDCDVDMASALPDALRVYEALLKRFPSAQCVGPMLRIRDVPTSYPLYNEVMNRHIAQFWSKTPEWVDLPMGRVAYIPAHIDTTFALHRAGEPFRRLKFGIRVYEPYEAQHLDWYLTPSELSVATYSKQSSNRIAHWSNQDFVQNFSTTGLQYSSFSYVDVDDAGELKVKTWTF